MKLVEVRVESAGGRIRVTGHIDGAKVHPFFAFPREMEPYVSSTADAFVPALLLPCLERGESLEVIPPISAQLVSRIPRILDVALALFPNFHRIGVNLSARERIEAPTGKAIASLFSGGVDSFYSLLKGFGPEGNPSARPTHLFFMRGLEQRLDESAGADATLRVVEEAAQSAGVGVLWGETNLRMLFGLNYELYYHAAALVGAALSLSCGIRRLLVPSTFSNGQLIPWGSHPLLDELWSTETTQIVHHGAEARRVDKIAMLVRNHRSTLRTLRVCLKNQAGPNNCGRCQKCARTMMALEILGALAGSPTFPEISRKTLAHWLRADNPIFVAELHDFSRGTGSSASFEFLTGVMRSQKRRHAVKALIESTPMLGGFMPAVTRFRRQLRGEPPQIPPPEFMGEPPGARTRQEAA
jgi:bacterioferritin-associated ferredoxin